MKRFFLLKSALVFILAASITQSCTNLDEEVFNELTTSNVDLTKLTPEQLDAAIADPYRSLLAMGSHNSFYSLNSVSTDQILVPHRGADWEDGGQWLRVNRHEYTPSEPAVENGWNNLYQGAIKCNFVIDLLESLKGQGAFADADLEKSQSEMRGLRAYYYYWLMDLYGNVPLVTAFVVEDPAPATQSRQVIYDFITSELSASLATLDKPTAAGASSRFNYWTARALQSRVYLNAVTYTGTAQWQNALDAANDVINNSPYALESDYFTNFNVANEGSTENIFTIPYANGSANGFNWAHMTLHYSSQSTFDLGAQPWNGYCALQEFYDSYDDADLRKGTPGDQTARGNFHVGAQFASDGTTRLIDASAELGDPDGQDLTFTPEINEIAPGAFRQAGARIGKYEYAIGAQDNLDNDFVMFRLGEMVLNAAEAAYRLGNSGDALASVNQIRTRAGMADFTALTDADMLAERGRELFMEGVRRSDLIRFGQYSRTWFGKTAASDATKNLMPIPRVQVAANPNLAQNPGY
jgi:hypothetical protein